MAKLLLIAHQAYYESWGSSFIDGDLDGLVLRLGSNLLSSIQRISNNEAHNTFKSLYTFCTKCIHALVLNVSQFGPEGQFSWSHLQISTYVQCVGISTIVFAYATQIRLTYLLAHLLIHVTTLFRQNGRILIIWGHHGSCNNLSFYFKVCRFFTQRSHS